MSAPTFLFLAGSHGDEYESGLLLQEYLHKQTGRLPSFFFIPKVSPSAVNLKTRQNKFGHDINRQFHAGTKDREAIDVMRTLKQQAFTLAIDIHEDPDRTNEFYLYDSGRMNEEELNQYSNTIKHTGTELFNGLDDPNDKDLCCNIDRGYYYFKSLKNTEGFFSKWALEKGIVKRVFTVEIPGRAPLDKKRMIIETILPFLISL